MKQSGKELFADNLWKSLRQVFDFMQIASTGAAAARPGFYTVQPVAGLAFSFACIRRPVSATLVQQ